MLRIVKQCQFFGDVCEHSAPKCVRLSTFPASLVSEIIAKHVFVTDDVIEYQKVQITGANYVSLSMIVVFVKDFP